MTAREQQRARVLARVSTGALSMAEAAALLSLLERQVWRLRTALAEAGPGGLVHGNRGRASGRRPAPEVRSAILAARTAYGAVNDSHFRELLAERKGIVVSRECVRSILRQALIASPRRRRAPAYRSRCPRLTTEGSLLQLDGSRHDWLEDRGPGLTLVGAIDDATGLVVGATFRDQEDAAGYLHILRDVVRQYGIPGAIYRDGHSAFVVTSPRRADPEDLGSADLTQVGRALAELERQQLLGPVRACLGREGVRGLVSSHCGVSFRWF